MTILVSPRSRRGIATFRAAAGTHASLDEASLEHLELERKGD